MVWWRRRTDADFHEEIQANIALETDRLRAEGMSHDDAKLAAVRAFGNVTRAQERFYESRRMMWLDDLWHDTRHAGRVLIKNPAFALVAVLTLALGIGATTAIYSVVYAVLLNPFPFPGGDRMVNVRLLGKAGVPRAPLLTARQLEALRGADVIDDAIAIDIFGMTLTGDDLPEHVRTQFYSSNALTFMGVQPALGRIFTEAEAPFGEEPGRVVVLTHGFWQRHYGGRSDVVGHTIQLDYVPYTVIGVTRPQFLPSTDVIVPIYLKFDPAFAWAIQTRLKDGVNTELAAARLLPLFQRFASEAPARFPRDFRVEVTRFVEQRRAANFVPPLMLVFGAALVLLLVACVTMSILLLARGASRHHEFVVRGAIGASRSRLLRQVLTESLLLALSGTVLGILIAKWGTPLVLRWLPPNSFPLVPPDVHVSMPVLLFSASLAVLTTVLFGIYPGLSLSRASGVAGLVPTGLRRIAGRVESRRTHPALIVVQVALTVLLLAGTGAGIRGLVALYRSTLGYDPGNVLVVSAYLPEGRCEEWSERAEFIDRLRARIETTPQIESAGLRVYGGVPPRGGPRTAIDIPGQIVSAELFPIMLQISAEYLSALRVPLVTGRAWSSAEGRLGAGVALVNQTMARAFWPAGSPLGQRIHIPDLEESTSQFVLASPDASGWVEVIGVVGDTPNVGLREPPVPAIYVPHTVMLGDIVTFTIRTAVDPVTIVRSVREQIKAVDPGQAITDISTADRVLAEAGWARERFVVLLLIGFGGFALALAALGLFSVVSFAVSQRLREFGIRMALGAQRSAVVRLALATPMRFMSGGLAAGIVLSIAANRILARWSIGDLADPFVLAAVAGVFVVTTLAAVLIPASRAVSIQPLGALRVE